MHNDITSQLEIFETKEITTNNSKRLYYLIKCHQCQNLHYKAQCEILKGLKRNKRFFCSQICHGQYCSNKESVICANCNKEFLKLPSQIQKSKNNFCSKSCAATFNNKNKTYGTRRSKMEQIIENNIISEFPNLKFICNNKEIIGSELDFYFPDLSLAIELNGIFHYEPIYGQEKFEAICKMDQEKRDRCKQIGIQLIEIDCSKDKYLNKIIKTERWNQVKNILIRLT